MEDIPHFFPKEKVPAIKISKRKHGDDIVECSFALQLDSTTLLQLCAQRREDAVSWIDGLRTLMNKPVKERTTRLDGEKLRTYVRWHPGAHRPCSPHAWPAGAQA